MIDVLNELKPDIVEDDLESNTSLNVKIDNNDQILLEKEE